MERPAPPHTVQKTPIDRLCVPAEVWFNFERPVAFEEGLDDLEDEAAAEKLDSRTVAAKPCTSHAVFSNVVWEIGVIWKGD